MAVITDLLTVIELRLHMIGQGLKTIFVLTFQLALKQVSFIIELTLQFSLFFFKHL